MDARFQYTLTIFQTFLEKCRFASTGTSEAFVSTFCEGVSSLPGVGPTLPGLPNTGSAQGAEFDSGFGFAWQVGVLRRERSGLCAAQLRQWVS